MNAANQKVNTFYKTLLNPLLNAAGYLGIRPYLGDIKKLVIAAPPRMRERALRLAEKINLLPYVYLPNQSKIIAKDTFIIQVTTNCTSIMLIHNNVQKQTFYPHYGKIEIAFDLNEINDGWNYYLLKGSLKKSPNQHTSADFFINKIPNQASVYIPGDIIRKAREGNVKNLKDYEKALMNNYTFQSPYFDFRADIVKGTWNYKLDGNGIPLYRYKSGWQYNPVTIGQRALGFYSNYIHNNKNEYDRNEFLRITDWFLQHQSENGAFPCSFSVSVSVKPTINLKSEWVSGMYQGTVLSVMARAWSLTGDDKYLECGYKALKFMLSSGDHDVNAGCSRKLKDFCELGGAKMDRFRHLELFEEYVYKPATYVLNGDLYALIGLADWKECAPAEYGLHEAQKALEIGIRSVETLLPYYDYYGWSSYSLFQYTGNSNEDFVCDYAHKCHIVLLHALASVTNNEKLYKYYELFSSYVDDDFWQQSEVMYRGPEIEKL